MLWVFWGVRFWRGLEVDVGLVEGLVAEMCLEMRGMKEWEGIKRLC